MIEDINEIHRNKIYELIEELLEVYQGNDWLKVKKYVLKYSHPDIRKYFTTRHHYTKKHTLNDFEKSLIKYCKDTYNQNLFLKKGDTHHEET